MKSTAGRPPAHNETCSCHRTGWSKAPCSTRRVTAHGRHVEHRRAPKRAVGRIARGRARRFGSFSVRARRAGTFTVVYDDAATGISGATTSVLSGDGVSGSTINLTQSPDVRVEAISYYSGYRPERVIDDNVWTSWFTRFGDAVNRGKSPFLDVILPAAATVSELQMFGNRQSPNGYDFYAGSFHLFDEAGLELFDSGVIELPAPERDVVVSVPDVAGVRRVRFLATDDESADPGFAELVVIGHVDGPDVPVPDIYLPDVGSVSGQLLANDGSATTSPTASVEVRSRELESQEAAPSATDVVDSATGGFHVSGVAEGDAAVTVIDPSLEEAGATTTRVDAGVETAGVNVRLGTARPLPLTLGDHTVQPTGSIDGDVASVSVNGKAFPPQSAASVELSGRQVVLGPVRMGGVRHARKIFVSGDGSFVRVLDVLENPHAFDVEATVTLDGSLAIESVFTSSGDESLDWSDRFVSGGLDGVGVAFVYGGAGNVRLPDRPATDGARYAVTWRQLDVPAGERRILVTYLVKAPSASSAAGIAEALQNATQPEASFGLDPAEKADVVNFNVPQ